MYVSSSVMFVVYGCVNAWCKTKKIQPNSAKSKKPSDSEMREILNAYIPIYKESSPSNLIFIFLSP